MKIKIAALAGDGIGPEVIASALRVLEKVAERFGHQLVVKEGLVGAVAIEKTGDPLPKDTIEICKNSEAILFGAIGDPKYDQDPSAKIRPEQGLLRLRKIFNLYANIRPIVVFDILRKRSPLKEDILQDVDFVVVRELTGGIYFGEPRGRSEDGEKAFDTCVYSREEILRVSRVAFELAEKRRRKITVVDKANVLATSRLWRESVAEIAKEFPAIEVEYMYVDNAAMQILKRPSEFDVILTGNMFGDILTDEASVIAGSLGVLPSASVGEFEGRKMGMYEPIHGSFPKAAGKDIANPIGAILSSAMMLRISFGLEKEALAIEKAVEKTLSSGIYTKDLGEGENWVKSSVFTEKLLRFI